MNFLPVRVAAGGGGLWLEGKSFRLPAPAGRSSRLESYKEKEVTLGVRPEDLLLRPAGPEGNLIRAAVEIVEAVGSDIFLDLNLAGASVTARVEATAEVRTGQEITLHPNPDRIHLFDPASGANLAV